MRVFRNVVFGLLVAMSAPVAADAGLIMTLTQNTGSSVLLTFSGAINTSGMLQLSNSSAPNLMNPSAGSFQKGSPSSFTLWFNPQVSGPASNFGSGGGANAALATGDAIYVSFGGPQVMGLPVGYTSLSALAGTMSFNGTFASLGITAGVRSFSWGGGGTGRTVTLNVVPAPIPEIDPATGSSALSLVAGMLAMIEQRRRRAALAA